MKVYVIYEEIGYDYEGTACQNIGVFISREKAFERVKQDIPEASAEGTEWNHPEKNGDDHTWTIEEWEVSE